MGSTVTTGKLAAAFKSKGNKSIFCLFEQTFEKNCYPHTPSWCCIFIGELSDAIQRIFNIASSCEGGMLQGRNGRITPEGYIAGWMKELSCPVEMPDSEIHLSVTNGFYATVPAVPADRLTNIMQVFIDIGRADIANELTAGKDVPLRLHADSAILVSLCRPGLIAPWRIIPSHAHAARQDRNATLGYSPARVARFDIHRPQAMRVDGDNRLLQRPDGSWYCAGWQYSIVQGFIIGLGSSELAEPGSYRKRIKAYREALESAPLIPADTNVIVDLTVPMTGHDQQSAESFSRNYLVNATPTGFEVTVNAENHYSITSLPPECATWIIAVVDGQSLPPVQDGLRCLQPAC